MKRNDGKPKRKPSWHPYRFKPDPSRSMVLEEKDVLDYLRYEVDGQPTKLWTMLNSLSFRQYSWWTDQESYRKRMCTLISRLIREKKIIRKRPRQDLVQINPMLFSKKTTIEV